MNKLRHLTLLVGALAVLGFSKTAPAQYALAFTGGPASVAPGESFTFTLTLTSGGETSVGLSYFLQVLDGGGNGLFRITGRDFAGSTFSDPTADNSIALQPADALLDPRNDSNLGAIVADPNAPNGAGSFFVANFTLQTLAGLAPGVYTISTADAFATDAAFGDNAIPDATYSVTVVPEPSTVAFALLGTLGFCGLRWRKQAARRLNRDATRAAKL